MRPEKKYIAEEYLARLKSSPFFLVVDYRGLSVSQFTELRKKLAQAGGELHVVKNTIFRICAKEAGLADLTGTLAGQLAVCTGKSDIAAAAKVLKTSEKEIDKPKIQFGYLGNQALSGDEVRAIADLPPLEGLRSQLVGLIQTPAQKLVTLINTPATQLARVLQAKVDKAGEAAE